MKKIVQGQFPLFQAMYKPILEELAMQDVIRTSNFPNPNEKVHIIQVSPNFEAWGPVKSPHEDYFLDLLPSLCYLLQMW